MKYMKNPITRFCFKWLQKIACTQPCAYYKKSMLANIREIKHQLSVLDRGLNGGKNEKV